MPFTRRGKCRGVVLIWVRGGGRDGGRQGGGDGGIGGMGCQHLGERVLEVEDGDSEELWEGLRGSAGVINDESGVRRWDRWDAPVSRPRPAHPAPLPPHLHAHL